MKKTFNRQRITVIATMGLGVLASGIIRPILPLYLTSIGVSPRVLGLMFSMAMVGMVFGEISWGWIADQVGIKLPLSVGTVLGGVAILFFAFTQNIPALFIVFLFWGLTRSALFGPGRGYIGAGASSSNKAASMAIIAVVLSASRSFGALPSGYIADSWGYQSVFYVACGVSLIGYFILLFGLGKVSSVNSKEKVATSPASSKLSLSFFRPFAPLCVITFLQFLGFGIMGTFLPLFASQVIGGISASEIGVLFASAGLVSMLLGIPMGILADRTGKKMLMLLGLLITGTAMTGMAFSGNYTWLIIFAIIQSVGVAMFSPASLGWLSDSVPHQQQSTAMGAYGGLCEDTGIIAGAALGGIIWSVWGPQSTFLMGTMASSLGVIIGIFFIKKTVPSQNIGAKT